MAGERGEVFTVKALCLSKPISPPPVNVFADPDNIGCCFILSALADSSSADFLKNDFWRWQKGYEFSTETVSMFLTKPFDSSFADIPLVDDTYGTFFEFGYFVDGKNRSYISYSINWKLVLDSLGEGTYQLMTVEETIFGEDQNTFDFAFCLKQYTPTLSNKTIRLEFTNTGTITDRFDESDRISFPEEDFESQLRVPGYFGKDNSDRVIERTRYNNNALKDIANKRIPKYSMDVRLVIQEVHDFIDINVLGAGSVAITDYNKNNPKRHISTEVSNPGAYAPEDDEIHQRKSVIVEWESRYDGTKEFCP